jgi:uncharacterized protein YndB with AHSA1/START domain
LEIDKMNSNTVGKTKDVGYEMGLRKTISLPVQKTWELLTSSVGLELWLGKIDQFQLVEGAKYLTSEGTAGEVRVVHPGVNLRLTWQPKHWEKASTLQLRTIPNGTKTILSFHQENLAGPAERAAMLLHWQKVLHQLQEFLAQN